MTAQYDYTLSELDELDTAWHQQQALVQEIIALRKELLDETEASSSEDITLPNSDDNAASTDEPVAEPTDATPGIPPAIRLAQLTAELEILHHTQLLVSPHVDKKQFAAVIAELTGVPLNRLSQN